MHTRFSEDVKQGCGSDDITDRTKFDDQNSSGDFFIILAVFTVYTMLFVRFAWTITKKKPAIDIYFLID